MRRYPITIEILSPVHIGTNEQIEPLEYVIRDGTFFRVSKELFIEQLTQEKHTLLEELIEQNDLNKLRTFIAESTDTDKALYHAGVTGTVETLYNEKLGDIENQLLVHPHIRSGYSWRPILPGSSLKGAIRTAIVSDMANEKQLPKPKSFFDELNFEEKVLGGVRAHNDPFRVLKIADIDLPADGTVIGEVSNVRRDKDASLNAVSIQMITEAVWSGSQETSINATGEMIINDDLWKYRDSVIGKITAEYVLKRCNDFYRDKFKRDLEFFAGSPIARVMNQMKQSMQDENTCLIRLGRYSGKLSVTLDNYRKPPDPVTRNIFDAIYPMGWVLLRIGKG